MRTKGEVHIMENMVITKEDISFLVKQSTGNLNMILSGMTALLKDNESKVAMLESQTWFQRMSRTITGKNKMTQQEIQRNHDKINMYMTQAMTELYEQSCIDREIMMTLGNQINSLYAEHVQLKQILGAFAAKLNEKIESVDNFHMLITELEQGIYKDKPKIVLVCEILSKLDGNTIQDERKLEILQRTLQNQNILDNTSTMITEYLMDIINTPVEDIGKIYLEMETISGNYIASLILKMIEAYHFLPDMARKLKNRIKVVEEVINEESLDPEITLSIDDIYQGFIEEKRNVISSFEIIEAKRIEKEDLKNVEEEKLTEIEEEKKCEAKYSQNDDNYNGSKEYFLITKKGKNYIVSVNPLNWNVNVVKAIEYYGDFFEIKENIAIWINSSDQCRLYWENLETREKGSLLTDGEIVVCSIVQDKLVLVYGERDNQYIVVYRSDGSRTEKKLKNTWTVSLDKSKILESHGRYYYACGWNIYSIDVTLENEQVNFSLRNFTSGGNTNYNVIGTDDDGFYCYLEQENFTHSGLIFQKTTVTTVRNKKYTEIKGDIEYTDYIALQPQYNRGFVSSYPIEEITTSNYKLYKNFIFSKEGNEICRFDREDDDIKGFGQVKGFYDQDVFLGVTNCGDKYDQDEQLIKIDLRTERKPVIISIEIPDE